MDLYQNVIKSFCLLILFSHRVRLQLLLLHGAEAALAPHTGRIQVGLRHVCPTGWLAGDFTAVCAGLLGEIASKTHLGELQKGGMSEVFVVTL